MEYGSCISTKDKSEDKFIVMNCGGEVTDSASTLDEAQVKAHNEGCAIVLKVLRTCGSADIDDVLIQLSDGVEDIDDEIEDN